MPDGKTEELLYKPVSPATVTRWCVSACCRDDPDNGEPKPRPVEERSLLCSRCRVRLDRQLHELPQLYTELAHAQSTAADSEGWVCEADEPADPQSSRTLEAQATIRGVLASWAQFVVDERNIAPPTANVAGLAEFLRRHVDWLSERSTASGVSTEINELTGAALRLIRAEASWRVVVATCSEPDCAGDLVAWMRPLEPSLPSEIRCSHNRDHSWPVDRWEGFWRHMNRPRS